MENMERNFTRRNIDVADDVWKQLGVGAAQREMTKKEFLDAILRSYFSQLRETKVKLNTTPVERQ
jgi:hypothetical protein